MKDIVIGILWAIGIIGLIFILVVVVNKDSADNGNTLISEFEYNGSSHYIYLDDELSYGGELDITIRKGWVERNSVMTFNIKPDITTSDIIQHFKSELAREAAAEKYNDSLVDAWQSNQKKVVERLKVEN